MTKVSVLCTTYNNEKTISHCLDSILAQRVDFSYEIVIVDDKSTDNTQGVILDFKDKYPDIIKVIIRPENVFSQGERDIFFKSSSYCSGEYLAICEGDDYWLDVNKLQKQFNELESNDNIDLCFHPSFSESSDGVRKILSKHYENRKIIDSKDIILGDGGYCPTCSLFLRKSSLSIASSDSIQSMPCGDYFAQIYSSYRGGAIYLPEVMSVYRVDQQESFTGVFSNANLLVRKEFYIRMCQALFGTKKDFGNEKVTELDEMIRRHSRTIKKIKKEIIKSKVRNALVKTLRLFHTR